jgi:hypothetical protein
VTADGLPGVHMSLVLVVTTGTTTTKALSVVAT